MAAVVDERPRIWRLRHGYRHWVNTGSRWRLLVTPLLVGLLVWIVANHLPLWLLIVYFILMALWAYREAIRSSHERGYWEARREVSDSMVRAAAEGLTFTEWIQRDLDTVKLRSQYGRKLRWWQL